MRHEIYKRRRGMWVCTVLFDEPAEILEDDDRRAVEMLDAAGGAELPGIGTRHDRWTGVFRYYLLDSEQQPT